MNQIEDWKTVKKRYEDMIESADKDLRECLKYRIECIDELLNIEEFKPAYDTNYFLNTASTYTHNVQM